MDSPENEFSTWQSHPISALSSSQKNIWNLEQLYSGSPMNIITTSLSINGTFKIPFLIEAIQLVLKSDSALRIQIQQKSGVPVQWISPYKKVSIPVFDFSQTGKEGLLSWEKAVAHEAFPINDHPLFYFSVFKAGETSGGVLFKIHHLISDGWSQMLIANRIASIYQALLNGEVLPKISFPDYSEHLKREQMYLDSEIQKSDEIFWKKQASLFKENNFLKKQTLSAASTVGNRKSFVLTDKLDKTLKVFCQQNHIAPFLLFYAALAIYQQKISNSPDICIGVPILNRPTFLEKQMTGMFVSTLPFVFEIDESQTFEKLIQSLAVAWYDLLRHQQYPFGKITELFRKSIPGTDRIFQVALSYQDTHLIPSKSSSLNFSGHWFYSGCQAEALVIHLGNLEVGSPLSIDYDYRVQLFSQKEITNLHESLIEILKAAIDSPQEVLSQLPILPKAEQEKILFQFNKNQAPIKPGSLYENLLKAAKEAPQKAALICKDTELSFHQLFSIAENFASAIHSLCPNGHELIAVTLPKGFLLIAAMIGIAQSGNAWVLLPQEFPSERLKVLLKESGAALWICDETNLEKAPMLTKIPFLSAEAVSSKKLPQKRYRFLRIRLPM
ncbi:condensation domain-containing protein [Caproicibacterium sp. BJN0003]|nr:condensation domain-containing protein [Caproicibacterium sp. BJN0003]UZT82814.1 condensation domain-containing protein [Caproicibacterium sp. BJN0003]